MDRHGEGAGPLTTVLMPVYDAERYLATAIESILAQTFTDFEFLIVDDGSSDLSLEIAEGFAKRDARIRIVRRPHAGLVAALNEGLSLSRGRYVARMDADDVALPQRLSRQLAQLERRRDLLCIGGAFEVVDVKERLVSRVYLPCEHDEIVRWALSGRSPISHSAATFRRESVLACGGYDEEATLVEDLDLWLRLSEKGLLANLTEIVSRVRFHERSVSERHQARQLEQVRLVCERAWRRRGLDGCLEPPRAWRPGPDLCSRQRFALKWARRAWRLGERRTAAIHFARAVRIAPFGAPLRAFLRRALSRTLSPSGAEKRRRLAFSEERGVAEKTSSD